MIVGILLIDPASLSKWVLCHVKSNPQSHPSLLISMMPMSSLG